MSVLLVLGFYVSVSSWAFGCSCVKMCSNVYSGRLPFVFENFYTCSLCDLMSQKMLLRAVIWFFSCRKWSSQWTCWIRTMSCQMSLNSWQDCFLQSLPASLVVVAVKQGKVVLEKGGSYVLLQAWVCTTVCYVVSCLSWNSKKPLLQPFIWHKVRYATTVVCSFIFKVCKLLCTWQ